MELKSNEKNKKGVKKRENGVKRVMKRIKKE